MGRVQLGVFDDVFFAPPVVFGVLIASLLVRFFATFRYASDGYAAMPANIRRLSLLTAPLHAPELLPGLPKEHPWRFGTVIAEVKRIGTVIDGVKQLPAFFLLLLLAFWFIPGWAYRFILKSTLWFWWVLFIIGGAPNVKDGIEGLRADTYRKSFSWVLIALAMFGVVSFLFGTALKPIIVNRLSEAPLPTAVALLMLIDWRVLSLFQWLSVLSSVMTLAVALWAQGLSLDYREVPSRKEMVEKRLPWLGHLVKWKKGVGMVSIALLMLYIALYANMAEHWLPVSNWAFGWLELLYGRNAEALLPQS